MEYNPGMTILGIDPGSRRTGYALIMAQHQSLEYKTSGVLKFDCIDFFLNRLGLIYHTCRKLVQDYAPQEIALESLIHGKNINSLSKLAQARGAMVAAFMDTHQDKVFEYSPNVIKNAVGGHGHVAKDSLAKTLQLIFPGKLNFKTSDESDALAIAVCHSLLRGRK